MPPICGQSRESQGHCQSDRAQNYLNQPEVVVEQVLTGRYADGLGGIKKVPDPIGFDPFPWHSMAVWILTQMKRWKQIDGDFDYRKVAEQVNRRRVR